MYCDTWLYVLLMACSNAIGVVQGDPVFLEVWALGLCLMVAHIVGYWALASAHRESRHMTVNKTA